jgi:peptidoglycan/LPS O-acetylase OafA/YrhL
MKKITKAVDWIYNKLRRKTNTTSFIPQIDGLRFFAILAVIFEHANGFIVAKAPFTFSPGLVDYWWFNQIFDKNGRKGVLLFFVISGFILAMPFAKHFWQQGKKVSLKSYFMRRLTRLEPPYILNMVFCYFVLVLYKGNGFAGMFPQSFSGLLPNLASSLVYMHNILMPNTLSVNPVSWSLEIEVQFYLLVPLLVLILRLGKVYRRTLLSFLVLFFIFLQQHFPWSDLTIYSFIQYFLLGFLLVDVYLSGFKLRMNAVFSFFCGATLLFSMVYMDLYRSFLYEYVFAMALFTFCVFGLTNDLWKRILSIRFLTAVGGMCYSIYLWHNLVISAVGNYAIHFNVSHSYPITVIWQCVILFPIILLSCTCFYLLIEQPCMDREWPVKLWRLIKKVVSKSKTKAISPN